MRSHRYEGQVQGHFLLVLTPSTKDSIGDTIETQSHRAVWTRPLGWGLDTDLCCATDPGRRHPVHRGSVAPSHTLTRDDRSAQNQFKSTDS